jgi:hypothetical protein
MIIVRVELKSARTGNTTELARMEIANDGGRRTTLRDYLIRTLRGRSKEQLDRRQTQREGRIEGHPSEREHVWNLVGKALARMGYGRS